MRVLVVYNQPVLPDDHAEAVSEHEIEGTAESVRGILAGHGFDVSCLPLGRDLDVLPSTLSSCRPHVVFNLFEGLADQPWTEHRVAEIMERMDVPFTGCCSDSLQLARSKHRTKRMLLKAGLPTPNYIVVECLRDLDQQLKWPVIVKPAEEDASIGIDQGSVVTNRRQLAQRASNLLEKYGPPVLVEEFIAGRELNVAIVATPELRVLPASEVLFSGYDSCCWPIVTYDAKWRPGSLDYEATPPRYPAETDSRLATRLGELALRAYRLLACRDYARVDFRVSHAGIPYILEVNPNPDFSPVACLAGSLASAGLTHTGFAVQLVRNAVDRRSIRDNSKQDRLLRVTCRAPFPVPR